MDANTKLKLIARHKITHEQFEKIITLHEWKKINKNKNYYYTTYQIDF